METYRVELWIDDDNADPDRMPDVNRTARARDPGRAIEAVYLNAVRTYYGPDRTSRFLGLDCLDANVYLEGGNKR